MIDISWDTYVDWINTFKEDISVLQYVSFILHLYRILYKTYRKYIRGLT